MVIERLEKRMAELDKVRAILPYREEREIDFSEWTFIGGYPCDFPKTLVHNFERYLRDHMNVSFSWADRKIKLNSPEDASYAFLEMISMINFDDIFGWDFDACMWGYYGETDDKHIKDEIAQMWRTFLSWTFIFVEVPEEPLDEYEQYQQDKLSLAIAN